MKCNMCGRPADLIVRTVVEPITPNGSELGNELEAHWKRPRGWCCECVAHSGSYYAEAVRSARSPRQGRN